MPTALTPTSSPIPATALPTLDPTREPTLTTVPLVRYSNPRLGLAVDYPADWEATTSPDVVDALAHTWSVIEFRSNLYRHGEQAFGTYVVTVGVSDSQGRSLTETVEYDLSPIAPWVREGIESSCCLTVGGEPAMDLLFPWPVGGRWGSRQIMMIHDGRQYRLTFYPQTTLDGVTPSDAAARAAFDAFLRTFTFTPVIATATPTRPTVTPIPTPTADSGDGASGLAIGQSLAVSGLEEPRPSTSGASRWRRCDRGPGRFGCIGVARRTRVIPGTGRRMHLDVPDAGLAAVLAVIQVTR